MLMEIAQQRAKCLSSDGSKPTYMKNIPKPTTWDTKDPKSIKVFLTEYETYCDVSDYIGNDLTRRG